VTGLLRGNVCESLGEVLLTTVPIGRGALSTRSRKRKSKTTTTIFYNNKLTNATMCSVYNTRDT